MSSSISSITIVADAAAAIDKKKKKTHEILYNVDSKPSVRN